MLLHVGSHPPSCSSADTIAVYTAPLDRAQIVGRTKGGSVVLRKEMIQRHRLGLSPGGSLWLFLCLVHGCRRSCHWVRKEIQFVKILGRILRRRFVHSKRIKGSKGIRAKVCAVVAIAAGSTLVAIRPGSTVCPSAAAAALYNCWWPLIKKTSVGIIVVGSRRYNRGVHIVGTVVRAGAGSTRGIVAVSQIRQLLGVFPTPRNGIRVAAAFFGPSNSLLQKPEIPPSRIFAGLLGSRIPVLFGLFDIFRKGISRRIQRNAVAAA